ncbi:polysaccharide deacetylase family protein [Streptomyces sp. NPDC003077]|uniref:polysaccharide deacetylase family protein n=1 Tax=Streptomyces sp. NPDC003077 TaxID=3154443 RepID=UPI0033A6318E
MSARRSADPSPTPRPSGIPRRAAVGAALALGATAAWHIGPAGTWLPAVRHTLFPDLDGQGNPGHVALTFDDGPSPESTPLFLRALDELSVRATFFVLGDALRHDPRIGHAIAGRGHEIAVHGWHHERPWYPTPWRDAHDLARAADLVQQVCGRRPRWYRPPYGILTGGRWAAARRAGMRPVLWSASGHDWTAEADGASVLAEITGSLRGGGTVLLHDSDCTSAPGAWHAALDALPELVSHCREAGLTVGPLAEHEVGGPGRGSGGTARCRRGRAW